MKNALVATVLTPVIAAHGLRKWEHNHLRDDIMKTRKVSVAGCCAVAILSMLATELVWAGYEGGTETRYGFDAGGPIIISGTFNSLFGAYSGYNTTQLNATTGTGDSFFGSYSGYNNTSGSNNSFFGTNTGYNNTSGTSNTFFGFGVGLSNTTGSMNTAVGQDAGYLNETGSGNVFLGYWAGLYELGSNKLYIDSCYSGAPCTSPLIYGEFDNHLLNINGVTNVAANGVAKSQMHFSLDNGDYGGFLTSVLQNNFFVSSGARYDSGNWRQLSADGNAVMAGSGGQGYRIFTHTGTAVGNTFNNPTLRLQIDYSGQFGINIAPVAGHEIHTATGAYEAGGAWVDGSSRELKDEITPLSSDAAAQALAALAPVTFKYKTDRAWQHVGFIAEDVPQLVAAPDRKGLAPMDIVAVLTKVVQEQKATLDEKSNLIAQQRQMLESIEARLATLEVQAVRK
jgi:hypothetical protein